MSIQNNNKLYSTPQERINTIVGDDGRWWELLRKAQLEYGAGGGTRLTSNFGLLNTMVSVSTMTTMVSYPIMI